MNTLCQFALQTTQPTFAESFAVFRCQTWHWLGRNEGRVLLALAAVALVGVLWDHYRKGKP